MSVTPILVNDQTEIDEVRSNLGGIGVLNVPEVDIDTAISAADQETSERTGIESDSDYKPYLRRKFKILLATSYLLLRFKNSKDQVNLINQEIVQIQNLLARPGLADPEDEIVIDNTETTTTAAVVQTQGWTGGCKRSTGGGIGRRYPSSSSYYNDIDNLSRY